jgi:uncharacterized membrane protein
MELNTRTSIQLLGIIITGLSAGLFYGWVVSVIPGTKKLSDQAYLETMQTINKEILNPGFFIIFFGALILLIASAYFRYAVKIDQVFYLTLAATILYGVGVIGITMIGNVPLNNMIEAIDLSASTPEDYQNARAAYEAKWNSFNLMRTISAIASFILILIAALKN